MPSRSYFDVFPALIDAVTLYARHVTAPHMLALRATVDFARYLPLIRRDTLSTPRLLTLRGGTMLMLFMFVYVPRFSLL